MVSGNVGLGQTGRTVKLDEHQRESLRRVLKQIGIRPTPATVDRFTLLIEGSIDAFRARQASEINDGDLYNELRALWDRANRDDPPYGQIRARVKKLPLAAVDHIMQEAAPIWDRVLPGESYPTDGFQAWAERASNNKLVEAILSFLSKGGARVRGRKRASGKRSASRFEPLLAGRIRGMPNPAVEPRSGGRPTAYAADELVRHLAYDWAEVTGQWPSGGRSQNGTCFRTLVRDVFDWLGLKTPDQSLRRHWTFLATVKPKKIRGGYEYR